MADRDSTQETNVFYMTGLSGFDATIDVTKRVSCCSRCHFHRASSLSLDIAYLDAPSTVSRRVAQQNGAYAG